jgi:uncharacterized membrane protein YcaP (DUF421 family)
MSEWLTGVDWRKYFVPEMSLPEILIWGTLLYVALTILMRVVPKRQAGSASISDILFVVLIGGVTVEGLGKHGKGITDFVLLLTVVMGWSYFVEWLTFRFSVVRRLLEPKATTLIRDGKVLKRNLDKEMIVPEELEAQLRLHEVTDASQVKEARLESEGDISVVRKQGGEEGQGERRSEHHESNGTGTGENGQVRRARPNQFNLSHEDPTDHSDVEEAVEDFLDAARRLDAAVHWHQAQADRHQAEAAELRHVLAEHGVKLPRDKPPKRRRPGGTNGRKSANGQSDAERN